MNKEELIKICLQKEDGILTDSGALVVRTGEHTGRSPEAKFIVEDSVTRDKVDWNNNKSMSQKEWSIFKENFIKYAENKDLFHQKVQASGDPNIFLHVDIFTSLAWHSLFALNMFMKIKDIEAGAKNNSWKLYYIPEFMKEARVVINISERLILIAGTSYAGEMKKSVFTVLNFIYPEKNYLPMHCSVNTDFQGNNPAIFFGLSGTGKTTLSADSTRMLLGDDEHGWTDDGLCNFEGGCYAKTINLDKSAEPQIWNACQRKGSILENTTLDQNGVPKFEDISLTENARASYPIEYIENANPERFVKGHPKNIIMLTCDAFGVLPPVARLSSQDAVEHFLLGYTAKVAGTEKGIKEPTATFSPCFGLPFMPRSPSVYANILKSKIEQHNTACWLVNTGWTGGPYGKGKRMPISVTRTIIQGILNGNMSNYAYQSHEYTQLQIPVDMSGVSERIMFPEKGWDSIEEYKSKVSHLMELFELHRAQL